jgi:hypothetical protein
VGEDGEDSKCRKSGEQFKGGEGQCKMMKGECKQRIGEECRGAAMRLEVEDPEEFEELMKLRQENPEKFREEFKEKIKEMREAKEKEMKKIRDLSEQYLNNKDEGAKTEIKGILTNDFDKRLAAEKNRLSKEDERAKKMKERVEKREKMKDQIISAKLEEIIEDPDLKW